MESRAYGLLLTGVLTWFGLALSGLNARGQESHSPISSTGISYGQHCFSGAPAGAYPPGGDPDAGMTDWMVAHPREVRATFNCLVTSYQNHHRGVRRQVEQHFGSCSNQQCYANAYGRLREAAVGEFLTQAIAALPERVRQQAMDACGIQPGAAIASNDALNGITNCLERQGASSTVQPRGAARPVPYPQFLASLEGQSFQNVRMLSPVCYTGDRALELIPQPPRAEPSNDPVVDYMAFTTSLAARSRELAEGASSLATPNTQACQAAGRLRVPSAAALARAQGPTSRALRPRGEPVAVTPVADGESSTASGAGAGDSGVLGGAARAGSARGRGAIAASDCPSLARNGSSCDDMIQSSRSSLHPWGITHSCHNSYICSLQRRHREAVAATMPDRATNLAQLTETIANAGSLPTLLSERYRQLRLKLLERLARQWVTMDALYATPQYCQLGYDNSDAHHHFERQLPPLFNQCAQRNPQMAQALQGIVQDHVTSESARQQYLAVCAARRPRGAEAASPYEVGIQREATELANAHCNVHWGSRPYNTEAAMQSAQREWELQGTDAESRRARGASPRSRWNSFVEGFRALCGGQVGLERAMAAEAAAGARGGNAATYLRDAATCLAQASDPQFANYPREPVQAIQRLRNRASVVLNQGGRDNVSQVLSVNDPAHQAARDFLSDMQTNRQAMQEAFERACNPEPASGYSLSDLEAFVGSQVPRDPELDRLFPSTRDAMGQAHDLYAEMQACTDHALNHGGMRSVVNRLAEACDAAMMATVIPGAGAASLPLNLLCIAPRLAQTYQAENRRNTLRSLMSAMGGSLSCTEAIDLQRRLGTAQGEVDSATMGLLMQAGAAGVEVATVLRSARSVEEARTALTNALERGGARGTARVVEAEAALSPRAASYADRIFQEGAFADASLARYGQQLRAELNQPGNAALRREFEQLEHALSGMSASERAVFEERLRQRLMSCGR